MWKDALKGYLHCKSLILKRFIILRWILILQLFIKKVLIYLNKQNIQKTKKNVVTSLVLIHNLV